MKRLNQTLEKWFSSDLFTWPELKKMFLTLLLDQAFVYIISVLTTMLVSRVGEAAMAAVSLVSTVNGMVSLIFTALATGGGIVVSRAKGRGDTAGIQQAIGEVTGVCFLTALVLSSAMYAGADAVVHLLYPGVEPLVTEYAVSYMRMMCISFIPFSVFNAIFNIFRNLGDTRSSLFLTIVINAAHLILSLLFINVFNMGVRGSGLSYIVVRTIGMAVALLWILKVHNTYGVRFSGFFRFSRNVTKELFSLGMPLTAESLLTQGGMLLVQMYIAKLPLYQTDAHGIANSVFMLYYVFAYSMTNITSTVCGQCVGAKDIGLAKRYCRNFIWIGGFIMAAAILIIGPLTPLVLKLYAPSQASIKYIYLAVFIGALPMPFIWCRAFLTTTTARAAGDSAFATGISLIALLIGRMMTGYLLSITLGLGILGIWLGQLLEWIFRTIVFRYRMKGTKWIKVQV